MSFLCSRSDLLSAVMTASRAVDSRSSVHSICGNVKVESDGQNRIEVIGYNLEFGVRTEIEADISETFSITVNVRTLSEILKKLPNDATIFEIKQNNNSLSIKSGSVSFNIKCGSGEEYPKLPAEPCASYITMGQAQLLKMVKGTSFAASTDTLRPTLQGLYLEADSTLKTVTTVAIDGFRLAKVQIVDEDIESDFKAIIPATSLTEIARLMKDSDDAVTIQKSDRHIFVTLGETQIISSTINGAYMDYEKIIPKVFESTVTLDKDSLLNAIDRSTLVINTESAKNFPVDLKITDDQIEVKSNSETGNYCEQVEVSKEGADTDVSFNPRYWLDALRAVNDDEILIKTNGSMGPTIITPITGSEYVYLILPLRK